MIAFGKCVRYRSKAVCLRCKMMYCVLQYISIRRGLKVTVLAMAGTDSQVV
jgi:hypothetical protein